MALLRKETCNFLTSLQTTVLQGSTSIIDTDSYVTHSYVTLTHTPHLFRCHTKTYCTFSNVTPLYVTRVDVVYICDTFRIDTDSYVTHVYMWHIQNWHWFIRDTFIWYTPGRLSAEMSKSCRSLSAKEPLIIGLSWGWYTYSYITLTHRVAKTHGMPYLSRSFASKKSYN